MELAQKSPKVLEDLEEEIIRLKKILNKNSFLLIIILVYYFSWEKVIYSFQYF